MGERLKELRLARNLTQKQVAEAVNLGTRAYNYYEQGLREPSIEMIKKLCKFFDVSSDYLIGLTDAY